LHQKVWTSTFEEPLPLFAKCPHRTNTFFPPTADVLYGQSLIQNPKSHNQ